MQLEKMAKAGGMSKTKLTLFFLEKRCIAPAGQEDPLTTTP
jgi:hypothetical protein